ncbi:hypothetical protein GH714_026318 [Hevea brasiliensis]|uniref:Tonoplast intrinsic protein n=1 Tax=Hevea brasiliensis TaxID=3981 RepID=A0A6A6MDC0_HEVBR|nr:hypothetical protein GH714_026318 [Hevea brasiliensis]
MLPVPPMMRPTPNQAKLAAIAVDLNIRLRLADMPGAMQERAFRCTRAVLDANLEKKPNPTHVAMCLKKVSNAHTNTKKLMPGADPSNLVIVAIANAFALSSAVYIAANVSSGHVNPAVTFSLAVGGHINVPTAIFYWISQMLASVMACLLLRVAIVGQSLPTYTIAAEMTGFGASVFEGVLTFGLVYTVYAAGDPRCSLLGATGPLAIGLMAGANVLAAGPFSGGSMNPACAFGSAIIAGSFKNQAVYWVGP